MRIAVIGAGAIGGHMAVRLGLAGMEMSIIARGAHLAAIQAEGLVLESSAEHHRITPRAVAPEEAASLGPQDVVLLATKAMALDTVAPLLPPLLGPHTMVVVAVNGLPWWYLPLLCGDAPLPPLEMGLALREIMPLDLVLGCTANSANAQTAPGLIHNDLPSANRFALGRADATPHCAVGEALAAALTRGGAQGAWATDMRQEVWVKLLTNVWSGPMGCLTGLSTRQVIADPALRAICLVLIAEAQAIAARCGITLPFDPETLRAERMPAHNTSMLQDLLRGRQVEYDAVIGALHHVARSRGVATPMMDTVYALLRGRLQQG